MGEHQTAKIKPLAIALAALTAISAAGSQVTLVALSSDLLLTSGQSSSAAWIQTMSYFGAAIVGLMGGYLIQRFTQIQVGIGSPLLAGCLSLVLFFFSPVSVPIGLACVLGIFVLAGLESPNYLSFLNKILPESGKIRAFSAVQSLNTAVTMGAPAAAGFISAAYGTKVCYAFDAATYFATCVPWAIVHRKSLLNATNSAKKPEWLLGFKMILQDINLRRLNLSRLINNIAYVSFGTAIPVFIGRAVAGDGGGFSRWVGVTYSALSVGFLFSSLTGLSGLLKKANLMVVSLLIPVLGFVAVALASLTTNTATVAVAAFLAGFGQFFFRISGITIGQHYTPKEFLAPIIIAGDSVVRLYSTGVSALAVFLLTNSNSPFGSTWSLPIFCSLVLFSPILLRPLIGGMKGQE